MSFINGGTHSNAVGGAMISSSKCPLKPTRTANVLGVAAGNDLRWSCCVSSQDSTFFVVILRQGSQTA